MTENDKTPGWADALLTLWVVAVGACFFVPTAGALSGAGTAFYAVMVLLAALAVARRRLHRPPARSPRQTRPAKKK